MRFPTFAVLLLLLFSALSLPSAGGAEPCDPKRFAEIRAYAERMESPAKRYAERTREDLFRASDELNERLMKATKAGHPEEVDLVVIGGGPHSAELYSSFHSTNPNLKAVVFEGTNEAGTFDRLGPTFGVNSKELENATGNTIYGSSVPLKAFNPKGETFVSAEALGDTTLVAHKAAKTPLAYGQWVVDYKERPAGANWPRRYLATTHKGTQVYTDMIVAAPGMGQPTLGIKDPASLAFAAAEAKKAAQAKAAGKIYVPLVEPLDETLARARDQARKGEDFLELYEPGAKVAVVGKNYGAMIAIEATGGASPENLYPKGPVNSGRVNILWLGQTSADFADFKKNNPNPRYWPTMEKVYEKGIIKNMPGRAESWRPTTPEEAHLGKVAIRLQGQEKPVYVDYVVTGTGYDNRVDDLFAPLVPKDMPAEARAKALEKRIVEGHLDQSFPKGPTAQVPITQQVYVNGRAHDVFVAGQATEFAKGKEIPNEEWEAATGGFLDILGRRTEALGRDLALRTGPRGFQPVALEGAAGASAREAALALPKAVASTDSVTAELELRVALQHSLYGWRLPPGGALQLSVDGGASPKLVTSGLSEGSAEKVRELLEKNPEVSQALSRYLASGKNSVNLSVGAKSDGRPIFESMKVTGR